MRGIQVHIHLFVGHSLLFKHPGEEVVGASAHIDIHIWQFLPDHDLVDAPFLDHLAYFRA